MFGVAEFDMANAKGGGLLEFVRMLTPIRLHGLFGGFAYSDGSLDQTLHRIDQYPPHHRITVMQTQSDGFFGLFLQRLGFAPGRIGGDEAGDLGQATLHDRLPQQAQIQRVVIQQFLIDQGAHHFGFLVCARHIVA